MKHKKISRGLVIILIITLLLSLLAPMSVYAATSSANTPSKVTLNSVSAPAYNKVTVKWKKASNVTSYRVYYKVKGASKWTRIATVDNSKTSYTHTNSTKYKLTPGQTYCYTVRAYNSKSKTLGSYNKTGLSVKIPGKPSKVTLKSVTLKSSNKVTVSWNKASNATAYRVYYKSSGASNWTRIATVDSSKTSYTHTSGNKYQLLQGIDYYYTVRAYNANSKALGSYDKTGKLVSIPAKKSDKPYNIQMPAEVANNTGCVAKAFKDLGFQIVVDNSVAYSGKCDNGTRTVTLREESDAIKQTMYHELGHFLAFISGKDNSAFEAIYKEEVEKFKNADELRYVGNILYSSQSHSEYFAECYHLYIKENANLKRILPKTYKVIDEAVKSVTPERIEKIKQIFMPYWNSK